jgi:hypothetical protein
MPKMHFSISKNSCRLARNARLLVFVSDSIKDTREELNNKQIKLLIFTSFVYGHGRSNLGRGWTISTGYIDHI